MKGVLRGVILWLGLLVLPVKAAAAELIPVGQVIGLQLYHDRVTVAAYDDILGGTARNAGLKIGDQILEIDGKTVACAEDVRGALQSIPVIQWESAQALGMNPLQVYTLVILPQTVRRLIPLSINLITRMVKTTSLVMMIGIVEVLKVAQQIIEANRRTSPNAAFGVFGVVFLLYFLICWPISRLAGYLEKRWS